MRDEQVIPAQGDGSGDRFPWAEHVTAPRDVEDGHVDVIEIGSMMLRACMNYLNVGLGLDEDELYNGATHPIVREMKITCSAEVMPGDAMRCDVRVVSRGRRSFVLEQLLRHAASGREAAAGSVVFVTISRDTGGASEIPRALWDAVERMEGRRIPSA